MGNHVPGTPLETLGSIYIRSALEFRNLENTTVRDQLSLKNNSKSNSYKPWGKGWGGGSISFVAIPAKWRYLQYCNELNILHCIKKGMLLTNLLINIINHIIPQLKKPDLFGIPLKWANTKKWGWDLWGQIHTKRSILAPQEVTFFGSFVHRKVGGVCYPVEDAWNPILCWQNRRQKGEHSHIEWSLYRQVTPVRYRHTGQILG